MPKSDVGQLVRWLGIVAAIIGVAVAVLSIVYAMEAKTTAQTLVYLAPETCGFVLVGIGLRAWIGSIR